MHQGILRKAFHVPISYPLHPLFLSFLCSIQNSNPISALHVLLLFFLLLRGVPHHLFLSFKVYLSFTYSKACQPDSMPTPYVCVFFSTEVICQNTYLFLFFRQLDPNLIIPIDAVTFKVLILGD